MVYVHQWQLPEIMSKSRGGTGVIILTELQSASTPPTQGTTFAGGVSDIDAEIQRYGKCHQKCAKRHILKANTDILVAMHSTITAQKF